MNGAAETRRAWSGFSLIELLVVVGVVALLVGLLIPALAAARESGRGVACCATLRQWGTAVNAYANESKGFLPRRGQGVNALANVSREADWFNALPPLLNERRYVDLVSEGGVARPGSRSVWMCPSAVESGTQYYLAYGMNMRLSVWDQPNPDRIDSVAPPYAQVFLSEGLGPYCSVVPAARPYSPVARHRGSVGIVFLDAHAGSFAGSAVGCDRGDPERGDVVWLVPGSAWNPPP